MAKSRKKRKPNGKRKTKSGNDKNIWTMFGIITAIIQLITALIQLGTTIFNNIGNR